MCSDAIEVIQAVNNNSDWAINLIISNTKKLALSFVYVQYSYSPRILNFVAHSLTKLSYSCFLTHVIRIRI